MHAHVKKYQLNSYISTKLNQCSCICMAWALCLQQTVSELSM